MNRGSLVLGMCLTFSLTVTACQRGQAEEGQYLTAVSEIGDVRDVVPATGVLLSPGGSEVRAQTQGVIERVLVKEGEQVAAGALLATLKASTVAIAQEEARASASASDAAIRQAQAALANAMAERDRLKSLVDRGFASSAALARAEGLVSQARAGLDAARAEAGSAAARMRRAATEATSMEIRASVGGKVTFSRARPGLQVSPSDPLPIFQTADRTDELILEIQIPEPDMGRVSMDSRVSFTVDAYPDTRNDAVLTSIGSAPLREGRFVSYRALARAINPGGILLPGMTASVELVRADSRRVLRIPARAIYFRPADYMPPLTPEKRRALEKEFGGDEGMMRAAAGGEEFGRLLRSGRRLIFALEDGKLARREVRVGAETDEFVEITSGLRAGETIVVRLRPKEPSKP